MCGYLFTMHWQKRYRAVNTGLAVRMYNFQWNAQNVATGIYIGVKD